MLDPKRLTDESQAEPWQQLHGLSDQALKAAVKSVEFRLTSLAVAANRVGKGQMEDSWFMEYMRSELGDLLATVDALARLKLTRDSQG